MRVKKELHKYTPVFFLAQDGDEMLFYFLSATVGGLKLVSRKLLASALNTAQQK